MSEHKIYKPGFKRLAISSINVGDRFRENMGSIEDLATSISDKNRLLHPIVVSTTGKLIAGGRRLAACQLLEWTQIPCNIIEVEHDLEAREIELLENIMRKDMMPFEKVKLVAEIDRLQRDRDPNWTQKDTAALIGRTAGRVSEQLQLAKAMEFAPELANAKTEDEARKMMNKIVEELALKELSDREAKKKHKEGKAARQTLYTMADDAYTVIDVFEGMGALPDRSIDFIECDPPYGIALLEQKRQGVDTDKWEQYVEVEHQDYKKFLADLAAEMYRVLRYEQNAIVWFGIQWYKEVIEAFEYAGFTVDHIPCIWAKSHGQTNDPRIKLGRAYETFFHMYKKNPDSAYIGNIWKQGRINVFSFESVSAQDKYHPTQKPVELMTEIYDTFVLPPPPKAPESPILIPFMGSGVSLLSALKRGHMDIVGFDLVEEYKVKMLYSIRKVAADRLKL